MPNNLDNATLLISIGSVVTYTDHDPDNPLRWGVFTGLVVDAQKTNLGNVRLRIRLKEMSSRGCERLERLVYSNNGSVNLAEKQDQSAYMNGKLTQV